MRTHSAQGRGSRGGLPPPWLAALDIPNIRTIIIRLMTIASIDVDLISLPAATPRFAWRRGLRGSRRARTTAVLRITTDDGAVGEAYHEWSGPMLADIVDRVLREELVGERADRREWLWHRLWELDRTEEFPIWLFGVVDVALWDLEGRRARRAGTSAARDLSRRDPGVRVDDDVLDHRGVPRRRRPVSRARLPRDQAARLG